MAKDEILADFGFSFNFNHIDNLRKKENCYDYIQRYYVHTGNNLYHILWNEYERIMNEQIEAVDFVVSAIKYYRNIDRLHHMKLILAQIPFYKWKDTLEKTGFFTEARLLNMARNLDQDEKVHLILKNQRCVIKELRELIGQSPPNEVIIKSI
jgi:hypothetical protein